jgi:cyclopropane fatty-acyl-phospholipid synthase-like methyltransferase|tara:strand:+ start:117 stop:656 length:540 start_codon:yes stop_codon:yes gene_type:complete
VKKNLYYKTGNEGNVDFAERWNDLEPLIDHNNDHAVLDVGCAEGLIAIELSKRFKKVFAFDIEPYRIVKARENAKNIENIEFSTESYMSYQYKNYDQVFCLGVYHKIKSNQRQKALDDMFKKCGSTLYLRVPVIGEGVLKTVGVSDAEVLKIAGNNNFVLAHRTEQRPQHGTIFKFVRH